MTPITPLVYTVPEYVALPESHFRDLFAKQYNGEIEVRVPFGRVDVVTYISLSEPNRWGSQTFLGALAVEVEPITSWQHGVRQALAYTVKKIRKQTRKLCTVFLFRGDRWRHIESVGE